MRSERIQTLFHETWEDIISILLKHVGPDLI